MPHLSEFQIAHRRARDHAVPHLFHHDLLRLGLLLHLFCLAPQRLIEHLLGVGNAEDGGRASSRRFRNPVGIARAGTRVQVWHELRLRDLLGVIRYSRLNSCHLDVFAVLQRKLDRALECQYHRRHGTGNLCRCFLRPRTSGKHHQHYTTHCRDSNSLPHRKPPPAPRIPGFQFPVSKIDFTRIATTPPAPGSPPDSPADTQRKVPLSTTPRTRQLRSGEKPEPEDSQAKKTAPSPGWQSRSKSRSPLRPR